MSRHIALALIATGLALVVVPFALARGVGARAFSKQLPGLGALSLDFVRGDAELPQHLEYVRLDSRALDGNLLGDSPTRELGVLLPPSYFSAPERRYPVVYLLHGLGARKDGHLGAVGVQRAAFRQMEEGAMPELILVAVDGTTSLGGSYYARSPAIGDFETYVVREIVGAVDARYRTRAEATWRAIAGFSMGGHGAIKLAMKYPGVFSSVGTLSASPLAIDQRRALYRNALARQPVARNAGELAELYPFDGAWTVASIYAKAAAFSSNPKRPPLFLELPFQSGRDDDPVWKRWLEEDPLTLLTTRHAALGTLDTLYMDRGSKETLLGAEAFDRALESFGIPFRHQVFEGGHADDFQERHLRMLRFLAMRWTPGA
ncbi:alpha/beta hydrolase [Pyxidicoccus sp. MSG2]|uniref:alpha/beta hydrolase n=1 Tax=Pyxidicoccus sp. MSG2 TaxID=2996790 RepID=UPI0022712F26|nr:alpha/beta hydrolase-fold protein [Pyxidicoccus sp. MSG2]MCY1023450.1 alpha/beta hydrolase-fold protein [Pyxidicoccus sp. MSG2]